MSETKLPSWVAEVLAERKRQDEKWGVQHRPDGTGERIDEVRASVARDVCNAMEVNGGTATWYAILKEETYEAFAESDPQALRGELVQAAAVCGAWIEDIDSRELHDA